MISRSRYYSTSMANLTGCTDAFKIQSHLMFFDTALNSADTMLRNIYEAFAETATKMWAYIRCLPRPKQPSACLVTRESCPTEDPLLDFHLIT